MFHLGWFLPNGFSVQEWPPSGPAIPWTQPGVYQRAAQQLERAGFDMLVIEDTSMVPDTYRNSSEIYLARAIHAPKLDPACLVPLIGAATERIGIVPTLVTSYYPPYLLARLMATLDHLTNGRAGWNIVTGVSSLSAQNYGFDALPPHDERYEIADEFVTLCRQLWGSWEPDAVVEDHERGVYADHTKVHRVDFAGRHFRSRGPLNVHPSPQLRPALVQAGASPRGRAFAARHADAVLALGRSLDGMKAYRDDIHRLLAEQGRAPSELKVLFLVEPVLGDTKEEALERKRAQTEVTEARLLDRLAAVSLLTGVDLSRFELDAPLPDVESTGEQTLLGRFLVLEPRPTLREMISSMIRNGSGIPLVGTAEDVAEQMAAAMDHAGGDGFLISGHFGPGIVERVVDTLVPALQRRGLVRTEYAGTTLRQHLAEF